MNIPRIINNFAEIYNSMSEEITPNDSPTFEDFKNENGITFWWGSDLMRMIGYTDLKSFEKAINRAIKACINIEIPHSDNFIFDHREIKGERNRDWKLTRFACYLTVMNADPKKPEVAAAQVYFVQQTRKFELFIEDNEQFDRLLIRDDIKEGNKSLASVANRAGVTDFAKFTNAGYRGMYNMLSVSLANMRGVEPAQLFNYMGRTELAANLFRITQTEEKIKTFDIRGQSKLEDTHFEIGRQVRELIKTNMGTTPEELPLDKKLPDVKKQLKKGYQNMIKEDAKKKTAPGENPEAV